MPLPQFVQPLGGDEARDFRRTDGFPGGEDAVDVAEVLFRAALAVEFQFGDDDILHRRERHLVSIYLRDDSMVEGPRLEGIAGVEVDVRACPAGVVWWRMLKCPRCRRRASTSITSSGGR